MDDRESSPTSKYFDDTFRIQKQKVLLTTLECIDLPLLMYSLLNLSVS